MSAGQNETAQPRVRRLAPLVLAGVALLWWALDRVTKIWALNELNPRQSVAVLGDVLQWHLTFNPGAAFSFLSNATWVFTLLAAIVTVAICVAGLRVTSYRWAVVIGLILAGTTGNLYDRLTRPPGFGSGYVIDFIYTPHLVPAVYNLADIGLCIAVPLLILLVVRNVPWKQSA